MLIERLKRWKKQSLTSTKQTKFCKLCFKEIRVDTPFHFINKEYCLCKNCYSSLIPIFYEFKIDNINCLSIYKYDEGIKTFLYQLKGCGDIELSGIFLERYCRELHFRYRDYILVPAPSYKKDDDLRGFNHVIEIFSKLKLPMIKAIYKGGKFKQAEHNFNTRKQIKDFLQLTPGIDLKNKKILLIDDVCTTGSTLSSCIRLLRELKPKKIEVLVMAKRLMGPLA